MDTLSAADEAERLQTLHKYKVLDTPPEQGYDDIVFLAALACETPIALLSLVDEDRQWFKARIGLDITQTPLETSFCSHAVQESNNLFRLFMYSGVLNHRKRDASKKDLE